MNFPEYKKFRTPILHKREGNEEQLQEGDNDTPEEKLENLYNEISKMTKDSILEKLKLCSPSKYELISLKLLIALGYGGSYEDAATMVGRPHDGGIDGIIKQDKLGLDNIYIQCKKWKGKNFKTRCPEIYRCS
jgi:restriction system protein